MTLQGIALGYLIVAWMAMMFLAVAEISVARRDETAVAIVMALLWPVSLCVLLVVAVLDGFIRRPRRSGGRAV